MRGYGLTLVLKNSFNAVGSIGMRPDTVNGRALAARRAGMLERSATSTSRSEEARPFRGFGGETGTFTDECSTSNSDILVLRGKGRASV